jgi:LacI family sucrose operon transcriptional repressor
MKEVADRAGVSITTVSRVMNNRGAISEKTRKKVFRIMSEMNYYPNEMARSLMTKKTHIIGLIVPGVNHPYFGKVVDTIEALCSDLGYKLLLCTSDHSSEKELRMSAMLRANKVDGVLLFGQREDPQPYKGYELPVVEIDKIIQGIPSVFCDNYQGGGKAAKTLIDSGCTHPIIFGFEDPANSIFHQRISGYRDECAARGVECREYIVNNTSSKIPHIEIFETHFQAMLEKYPDTDGLFSTNETIASRVLLKSLDMGISVPDNLQIVSYDGTWLSELLNLTTIAQPTEQMCSLALEILIKRMDGVIVPTSSVLPVTVIRRGSTKN